MLVSIGLSILAIVSKLALLFEALRAFAFVAAGNGFRVVRLVADAAYWHRFRSQMLGALCAEYH
jgi:hypothetical protein